MKERPILMSTEMVQSTLKGWKTQTRRMRGLELINATPGKYAPEPCMSLLGETERFRVVMRPFSGSIFPPRACVCDYGKPGDILWVRETWHTTYNEFSDQWFPIYRADGGTWIDDDGPMRWKPSIHMPKKYARIWLRITNIRLERLWDISPEDAIKEGIERRNVGALKALFTGQKELEQWEYRHYLKDKWGPSPVHSFETLWTKINGAGSWLINPWTWVISFEVLSTTGLPASLSSQTAKIPQS